MQCKHDAAIPLRQQHMPKSCLGGTAALGLQLPMQLANSNIKAVTHAAERFQPQGKLKTFFPQQLETQPGSHRQWCR